MRTYMYAHVHKTTICIHTCEYFTNTHTHTYSAPEKPAHGGNMAGGGKGVGGGKGPRRKDNESGDGYSADRLGYSQNRYQMMRICVCVCLL